MEKNSKFLNINCPACDKNNFIEQKFFYTDRQENPEGIKYLDGKYEILTCSLCEISFCYNIPKINLDNYYKSIYKNIKPNLNKFKEFNSRFFSQVLFFINHSKLKKNIKVLEVGPNAQGILPTLKIFQKNIIYYYFEQLHINKDHQNVTKLGDYYDPDKDELPNVDLIWMSHSLEHIHPNDLNKIIKNYYNALNPGGKIFIEIPDDFKTGYLYFPHTLFFTKKSLSKLFQNFKYKITAVSEINSDYMYRENKEILKNNKNLRKSLITKFYLFFQKFLPEKFIKKYAFKNFVTNGPATNLPIIRMIVEK